MSGREAGRGVSPAADRDAVELAPGTAHPKLEGSVAALDDQEQLRAALEQAFDYRGDVRITRRDGSQVEGYIFDRRPGSSLADSYVRLMPKEGGAKISISYLDVAGLAFSGRDMAAGKNWETWVRNYWQRKAAGETNISLQPEKLE
jgi:hypothetical protein